MHPFLIALQFLTRIPVHSTAEWLPENTGRSLLYYPLIGALIGVLLVLITILLQDESPLLAAALLLSCWVLITGGLHLDGLADSADAWAGAHGDKQRALDIMKDAHAGPMAMVMIMLVLLLKFSALYVVLQLDAPALLLIAPMLGRSAVILLFLTTPYVREQGLGCDMKHHLPQPSALIVLGLVCIALIFFSGFMLTFKLIVVAVITLLLLRYLMLRLIHGMTGDTLGASIEVIETVILCALAMHSTIME